MGAANVANVYAYWAHLDDQPHRALVHMALISLDAGAPPRYFGGMERIAEALGRTSKPLTSADVRAVRRAVKRLTEAGAITRCVSPAPGRRSEYELWLTRPVASRVSPLDVEQSGRSPISPTEEKSA